MGDLFVLGFAYFHVRIIPYYVLTGPRQRARVKRKMKPHLKEDRARLSVAITSIVSMIKTVIFRKEENLWLSKASFERRVFSF